MNSQHHEPSTQQRADPSSASMTFEPEEFDELDAILDDLRTRDDETPQWEFCEGFMAALICCRRLILPSRIPARAAGIGDDGDGSDEGSFADDAQTSASWRCGRGAGTRWPHALNAKVETLDDERAYHPEVMDVRGAVAALPEEARAEMAGRGTARPSRQVWALGFMFAVESWPEEWAAPRDKEAAEWLDDALDAIVALTEDDTDKPALSVLQRRRPAQRERRAHERLWRRDLGGVRPARALAQPGPARGDRAQGGRARPQRPLPLRQRQEIQEVLRRVKFSHNCRGSTTLRAV